MPKCNFTTVLVVVIAVGIGYLAFDPTAARDLSNWIRREIGTGVPDANKVGHPNYTPVIPAKGL
jgi:hypothetical protein